MKKMMSGLGFKCDCGGEIVLHRPKDDDHPIDYDICLACGASQRHRLILRTLKEEKPCLDRVLHLAPEKSIYQYLKPIAKHYVTGDFPPRETEYIIKADYEIDIRKTNFPDNYFDLIICSHVLDDIKEDDLAIKELRRILKGELYLILPIYDKPTEELKVDIGGNWRRCGMDYWGKFKDFDIRFIQEEELLAIMK